MKKLVGMKTVTLTGQEVSLLIDDVRTTLEYFDAQLSDAPELGCEWAREEAIHQANAARSILKKLGVEGA